MRFTDIRYQASIHSICQSSKLGRSRTRFRSCRRTFVGPPSRCSKRPTSANWPMTILISWIGSTRAPQDWASCLNRLRGNRSSRSLPFLGLLRLRHRRPIGSYETLRQVKLSTSSTAGKTATAHHRKAIFRANRVNCTHKRRDTYIAGPNVTT